MPASNSGDSPPAQRGGPRVAVIILVRDQIDLTRDCLTSLLHLTSYANYEVTVIDNASQKQTANLLAAMAEQDDRLRVVTNAENRSFSAANNQGVASSQAELYLFLNNDTVITDRRWLTRLVDELARRPNTAATGPRLLFPDGKVQSAGIRVDIDAPTRSLTGATEIRKPRGSRYVEGLTAACLLVRARHFAAIEGFDEGFFYGQEDVDLCLRLRARGLDLYHCAEVSLIHKESSTRTFDENTLRNRARIREKWRGQTADVEPIAAERESRAARFADTIARKLRKLRRDPAGFLRDAWIIRRLK